MGTWGDGIFDSDVTADVRDVYRQYVGDGVDEAEAERLVLGDFLPNESETDVLAALAAAAHEVGRISPGLRDRLLAADPAECGDEERRERLRLAQNLALEPRPARARVRAGWRPRTTLAQGDVLAIHASGRTALLRVAYVHRDQNGSWPVLEPLEHVGDALPHADVLAALPPRLEVSTPRNPAATGRLRPVRWAASPNHRGEPSWEQVGFALIARTPERPSDLMRWAELSLDWPSVRRHLEARA